MLQELERQAPQAPFAEHRDLLAGVVPPQDLPKILGDGRELVVDELDIALQRERLLPRHFLDEVVEGEVGEQLGACLDGLRLWD